ncbi:phage tail assembly protein [Acidovorax sp. GBBC 3332]|nr:MULTISPECIES: phage tail assembly protein [unclassified Acidovorax]MDA8449839.1 phage tail assembly protein [Acidovorax sp. GBBC 3297]MDA8459284.1 phage tail assembly protein [Acidovorax sp. GBBC 3333]MDA8464321.1 phage tail assembly protein [Acidovorax sp. GBBC 3332]MDA8469469.1 phage tail assembly protein [Acidovorax sp. GBBC 3299]
MDQDQAAPAAPGQPQAGGIEIPLKFPIQSGGQRIEKLTMRRGTRKDMKAATKYSKDEVEQEDFLFARLTGLTLEDIDAMDLADSNALQDTFRGMVG